MYIKRSPKKIQISDKVVNPNSDIKNLRIKEPNKSSILIKHVDVDNKLDQVNQFSNDSILKLDVGSSMFSKKSDK